MTIDAETVKTITRPILTFTLILGWILMALFKVDVSGIYQTITSLMVAEWVTERGILRYKQMLGKNNQTNGGSK